MTSEQAKFILQACRPGGQDLSDPAFAEALVQAERDPALRAWWEREQAFDSQIVSKCKMVVIPEGLRSAILAGGRASRPVQTRWKALVGLGIAASFAITVGLVTMNRVSASDAYVDELVQHGLTEMVGGHPRGLAPEHYGVLGEWLSDSSKQLGLGMPVDLATLRDIKCRSLQVAGREVFEICFRRDTFYHMYIARRSDFSCRECEVEPMFRERGEFASVSWVDDDHVYVLVSRAGLGAIKKIMADPATLAMR